MSVERKTVGLRKVEQERGPRANFSVSLDPEKMGWLHGTLLNQPKVPLYEGSFIEPFSSLKIATMRQQNRVVVTALFDIDPACKDNFGQSSIGSQQVVDLLLKRYPEHQLLKDREQLTVGKNGKPLGVIARANENQILIQVGGQVSSIELSDQTPVNDLAIGLNTFDLLLQRYVSYTWQALPEMQDKKMNLALDLPQAPSGTAETYFSTFELIGREFRVSHREVDLETGIGGFQQVKDAFASLILDLNDPEKSRGFGTQPFSNRFVLLTGKEGTGKSLFLKGLDTKLRRLFQGKAYEHFRLPINDIIQQYGTYSHFIVKTVLDHIRENESKGVTTVLHLDNLQELCPPDNQTAYIVYSQTASPIIKALRLFGKELGSEMRNILVIGESRVPRQDLPEGIQRTFRRSFELKPSRRDLFEALRVQIAITRRFAEKTGIDPFDPSIDNDSNHIFKDTIGLTPRDIQQALLNIASRNKASGKDPQDIKITPSDIAKELINIQIIKVGEESELRHIGFRPNSF